MSRPTPRWLVSPSFDVALFTGPAILSVLLVWLIPGASVSGAQTPLWAWLLFVVGVDVAHVWASLYRTYLDREELARRRSLYVGTPLGCWLAGVMLYSWGPLVFWRVLAYVAVFHFVRQQYGFVALYEHRLGERGRFDRVLDRVVIYLAMLYPLAFWHGSLPRSFEWFVEGDFVSVGAGVGPTVAAVAFVTALSAFVVRQVWLLATGRPINPGKALVVFSTALSWYVGIVLFNSDFAFTMTNVLAHGVPYFALVWIYLRRRAPDRAPEAFLARIARPRYLPMYVGLLFAIAFLEEGAWDVLVWQEHTSVFGAWPVGGSVAGFEGALGFLVPLLAVPQATHYILDAFLWKFDGSNPGLREALLPAAVAEDRPPRTPELVK